MAKYRKKPVVIDAALFDGTEDSVVEILAMAAVGKAAKSLRVCGNGILIHTLEGVMTAGVGDYVIKGVQGELYPCKPAIFTATYEKVEG